MTADAVPADAVTPDAGTMEDILSALSADGSITGWSITTEHTADMQVLLLTLVLPDEGGIMQLTFVDSEDEQTCMMRVLDAPAQD